MRLTLLALPLVAVLAALPSVADAQVELRNDSFENGSMVAVQGGFVPGEIAASRFFVAAPTQLLSVKVIFANELPGGISRDVTLHVWADDQSSNDPGVELFNGDFTLMPTQTAFSDMSVAADSVVVSGYFRVGIEVHHMGPPSVVNDLNGFSSPAGSLLREATLGWRRSSFFGISGDWVLRAVVAGGSMIDAGIDAPIDAVTPGDAMGDSGTNPDAPVGPDGGTGACQGNPDCAIGTYCDPDTHACTFDCRTADDCGGDTCNSLGQCVAGTGGDDDGGCCSTGEGGLAGALGLGGLVALLLSCRRRRR